MNLRKKQKHNKRNNSFEATMPVDNPDIKILGANYNNKPAILAIGTSVQRELSISGEGGKNGVGGKYQSQKELKWSIFINRKNLPDFEPLGKKQENEGA